MSHSRIMFAGTGSGCGKTTVTCAVMKAFCSSGVAVTPFKCGPDYIDPMFHSHITGRTSTNLDSYFLPGDGLRWLMKRRLDGGALGIVEGVMGLFDGIGMTDEASSFEVARLTETPVILVVNARGMALSIIALLKGFKEFALSRGGGHLLRGVILNHVGAGMYHYLKDAILEQTGMEVVGYFEEQSGGVLESRHLGLITAAEISDLDERMERLGQAARASLDLKRIRAMADSAPDIEDTAFEVCGMAPPPDRPFKPRLAVARDKAFCFYYKENLEFLEQLGVEIVPFCPLTDKTLPEHIAGIYLGGGYPELFADELSQNLTMRRAIRDALSGRIPTIAECGGFIYLHESLENRPMVGAIAGTCRMTKKLGPFGYVRLDSEEWDIFGAAGFKMRGHEFHYSQSDNCGECYTVSKSNGRSWREIHANDVMYAGYPHLYFYSNPVAAAHFVAAMEQYEDGR